MNTPDESPRANRRNRLFAAVDLGSNNFRLHVGLHDDAIRVVQSARGLCRTGSKKTAAGGTK